MFHLPDLNGLAVMIAALLFAVTVHEVAHGAAALRMGDPTARLAGRLTLNPIRHLDPVGSLLLPIGLKLAGSPIVFGYAKPVPVNPANFRNLRRGTLLVSGAGVAANLGLTFVSGLLFRALVAVGPALYASPVRPLLIDALMLLGYSAVINAVLAVFNLIPIPPLDGSRLLAMVLPDGLRRRYAQLERYGFLILIVLLMTGAIDRVLPAVISPLVRLALGRDGLNFISGL